MFRSQEQANFSALLAMHMVQADGPLLLEGGTGLGKTRAYLAAIMDAAARGVRVAIALPSHQLVDQLLASSDVAATRRAGVELRAFRPARWFNNRQDYSAQRQAAMDAAVMVCTSASVIIDQRLGGGYNGATQRAYVLFDEADQLPAAAALQSDCEISAQQLQALGISATTAQQAAQGVLRHKEASPEIRAAALMILETIAEPAWFHKVGFTDDGSLVLWHKLPGRLLKKVANGNHVAFVSATLSIADRFDDFCRAMGIARQSALSCIVEPAQHGHLRFEVSDLEVDTPQWLAQVQAAVARAERPALVATPSHGLAQLLGGLIAQSTVRQSDETATQAVARMGSNTVLIAAGAWAGLDTPTHWASVVVPRIPFERPVVLDAQVESSFLDARNAALRRMRQVVGRGLRTPQAVCSVYILDGRYKNLQAFVPQRFRQAWNDKLVLEGGRVEVLLSKLERDPSVRKRALAHYGALCQGCGFSPKVPSQLDVHHLRPLADGGERLTGLQDLAVLCANCHRLAHAAHPPLAVEAIRALHAIE